jgi:transcriptional regulator with PAS, ATPase and Fis domain
MIGSKSMDTLTRSASPRERVRGAGAALFVVIQAEDPRSGGARIGLAGMDRVVIGRGAARGIQRLPDDVVRLDLPDPRVSVHHAEIDRTSGRWTIADAGSKNGLFVNGERVTRQILADGDWIEIGHTFLRFREHVNATTDADAGARTLVPSFEAELEKARQIAGKPVPVLLLGETGTGKEVLARWMHAASRRSGPFVAVNCGAIPATLVESTLFGHRKGAFSGAIEDRPGVVASAEGGTLLLDEIGDLPLAQQPALLRVIQEREVVPVGDSRARKVDVRFVAATHHDLDALVRRERFRADLLARLAGVRITLPPLRERLEDLGLLVAAILGAEATTLARDAAWAMCRHAWPFNVRELEQALAGALAATTTGRIELAHLPPALQAASRAAADRDEARRDRLLACLREHHGNLAAVARALGTSRAQIHRLLERYAIDPDAHR